jgi:hypothetical protein
MGEQAVSSIRTRLETAVRNWRAVVATTGFSIALVFAAFIVKSGKVFWDFAVYRAGIAAHQAGANAYDPKYLADHYNVGLQFIYPPLTLLSFTGLAGLFTSTAGAALLLLAHLAAFIAIPFLLVPREMRRTEMGWLFGLYLVAFGLSGTKLFLSGNIAGLLGAALILATRHSVRQHSYAALWIVLLIVCQIKIYFITFLIVPFLLERNILKPLLGGALILLSYSANYFIAPELFHQFSTALLQSSQSGSLIGTSVMSAAQAALTRLPNAQALPVVWIALAIHAVYSLLVVMFAAVVLWSRRGSEQAEGAPAAMTFLWVLMTALLLSPRLLPYDLALLVIPFVLLLRHLLLNGRRGRHFAGAALVISASLGLTPLADWAAVVALLGVWAGMGFQWLDPAGSGTGYARKTMVGQ